jgi:ankyrin repeat protein
MRVRGCWLFVMLLFGLSACASTCALGAQQDDSAALFDALKSHDLGELKSALKHGASPASRDSYGHGIFNIAAQNGDIEAMKVLLDAGADIDGPDKLEMPPIIYAVNMMRVESVEFLLARGAKVDARDHLGHTALIQAVNRDSPEMVRMLLKAGADVNALDRTRVSLLMQASLANTQDVIPLLEKAGARYASAGEEMMAAASYGDAVRLRVLIAAGAPLEFRMNSVYGHDITPLMAAALQGQTVAVRALLAAGANVNAVDSGRQTALFYAFRGKHRSTIDELVAAGSDVMQKNGGGETILMRLASTMDDAELARRLIDAGADPGAQTTSGSHSTALMQAAIFGHTRVLKVLLDAGAPVDVQTTDNHFTALIEAALSGHTESVQLLLKAGADPGIKDKDGKTALDWARQNKYDAAAAALGSRR